MVQKVRADVLTFACTALLGITLATIVTRLQYLNLLTSRNLLVDKLFPGRQALLCWQDRLKGKSFPTSETFVLNEIPREISDAATF